MSDAEQRPSLPVPSPAEVAASLPIEAVRYDPENPPVSGSVQRNPEGHAGERGLAPVDQPRGSALT